MNTFFIADPHFGHEAIIRYENRPFASKIEMDILLVENWNSVVSKQDKVYLLGDIYFYNLEETTKIIQRLKGKKYVVMGNHDEFTIKTYYEMGFHRAYDTPIILDDFLYINANMPYGNIYGHVHANKAYCDFSEQSFCVSVERIDYIPITFDTIKEKMSLK